MTLRVELGPLALDDLQSIFRYVAEAAGTDVAQAYDQRIRAACRKLADFPARGRPRDDLAPGLRTIPFERRGVIAYSVESGRVLIVRIMHPGRDLQRAFDEE